MRGWLKVAALLFRVKYKKKVIRRRISGQELTGGEVCTFVSIVLCLFLLLKCYNFRYSQLNYALIASTNFWNAFLYIADGFSQYGCSPWTLKYSWRFHILLLIPLFFLLLCFEKWVVSACLFFPSEEAFPLPPVHHSDRTYSSLCFSLWCDISVSSFKLVSYCSSYIPKIGFLLLIGFSALILQSEFCDKSLHSWTGKLKKKGEKENNM